jgi:hypothetical protein
MESSVFWDISRCSPLKVNGLHGIISQKTGLSISTAVRTSDPISRNIFQTEIIILNAPYVPCRTQICYKRSRFQKQSVFDLRLM